MKDSCDLIVIGGGPAGLMAAITAGRRGHRVCLLEKLPQVGAKLKATGGGRCNLTNTLEPEEFMARFGREGRFMTPALRAFNHHALREFFTGIGVATHAPDGRRVFPIDHRSTTVVAALEAELKKLGTRILTSCRVEALSLEGSQVTGVKTVDQVIAGRQIVLATGGLGYPALGADGDGYAIARAAGHTVTDLFPAMLPLRTRETWVRNCRADTIGKAELRIDLPKIRKRRAIGDLIFTADGIRGPVVLDVAREITPLLAACGEVPLLLNFVGGLNEEEVRARVQGEAVRRPEASTREVVGTLVPDSLALELCRLVDVDPSQAICRLSGERRARLLKILASTPLTVIGHEGFSAAMITRGGVSLKEVHPETLESRLLKGLYFCGEILDLDGPCGGFNLQWSFSSGFLAGHLRSEKIR